VFIVKRLVRTLFVVSVVLLIPIVPFLVWGPELESWMEQYLNTEATASWTAAAVVGLLSTDVFLPVPSSVVITLAGGRLGVVGGTAAAWTGMSLGAILGFALARRLGRPLAQRLLNREQWELDAKIQGPGGTWLLVVTRALPVLAEAMVLLAGVHRMSWGKFLPAVLLSNLGIAIAYTALGSIAAQQQWLPVALGIAAALPLLFPLLTAGVR
jgi:uncharacterized membrane protein YdjX (TVP38/TMEM64 family)